MSSMLIYGSKHLGEELAGEDESEEMDFGDLINPRLTIKPDHFFTSQP